ncbi:MAG: lipoprotein insertase outer membrane protein LolB [Candidatus Accumulibacter necessarius]|uniref:lipoprotein insertase outer membrane protein LolB n=1 Tax=Candidatus Accumulibacter necessarius TaxID=2954386 RepID=UPI002FC2EC14
MKRHRSCLYVVGVLVLSACVTPPLPASVPVPIAVERNGLDAFSLSGRFSMRHEGKSYVGQLTWRHDGADNELVLSSPLGQGLAEIISDSGGARLTGSDGRSQTAANADELLQSALAYPLSLSQLLYWLRGRNPDHGKMVRDALGRPLHLSHEDWRIDYDYDSDDPQALPGRLFVEREGGFTLRLRIDQWQRLPADTAGDSAK